MLQQNYHLKKLLDNEISHNEEKLIEKLSRKYAPRPYSEVWRTSYLAASLLSFLFNIYSLATGTFAMAYFLYLSFAGLGTWLAAVLACILALGSGMLLELLKRNNSTNLFQHALVEKEWKKGYITGMVLLIAISIALSFYGSRNLPTATTPFMEQELPVLVDVQSIANGFEFQKEELKNNIKELENRNSYKGKTVRSVRDEVAAMRLQLSNLPSIKQEAIAAAETRNREAAAAAEARNWEALQMHEKQTHTLGNTLGYIAIATELLFLLCIYYTERYLYGCALERKEATNHVQGHTSLPQTFIHGAESPTLNQSKSAINPIIIENKPPEQAPFTNRVVIKGFAVDKKPQAHEANEAKIHCTMDTSHALKEVLVVKNTYTHIKRGGDTTEMSLGQVRSRVAQYERQMERHAAKLAAGEDGYKPIFENAKKQFLYWRTAEAELEQKIKEIGG